ARGARKRRLCASWPARTPFSSATSCSRRRTPSRRATRRCWTSSGSPRSRPASDVSAELDARLRVEMARWESRGLRRDLDGQSGQHVDKAREFTSNDYLSLAGHPALVAAAREAIERFG